MNQDQAIEVLAVLTAAYPNAAMPEPTVRLWLDMLTPLHPASAGQAARDIIRTSKFMPSIAEFLEVVHPHEHRRIAAEANTRPGIGPGEQPPLSPNHWAELRCKLARIGRPVADARYLPRHQDASR